MSNLIKAYNIRYNEDIKPLDMNEISEQRVSEFIEKDAARKSKVIGGFEPLEFPVATEEEGAGIYGEDYPYEDMENAPVSPELSQELDELTRQIEENKATIEEQEAHIAELQEQANLVFENTKREAERTIAQANLNANKARIEIFEKAKQEGYDAGASKAQEELEAGREELERTAMELQENYEKQIEALEPGFVELLIKYIRKITGILLEDRKDIIMFVIDRFIKQQENAQDYIIRVSGEEYELVKERACELEAIIPKDAGLEIIEDKLLKPTQCMIECDSKLFDVSLSNNLEGLITDLKLLTMQ